MADNTELSVIVITLNEEDKIKRCLEAVSWASEIVLIDSFSGDKTVDIASKYTDKIFLREFDNFAAQKNFALKQASCDWILSIDADEIVSDDLKEEILRKLRNSGNFDGYYIPRRNYFLGKELKHGGTGKDKQLRLFRKNKSGFRNAVHEEVDVNGDTDILRSCLLHYSSKSLADYFKKYRQYTDLEARLLMERPRPVSFTDIYFMPFVRFAYTYVFKLGFLDGYEGFIFHALSSVYFHTKLRKYKNLKMANSCA